MDITIRLAEMDDVPALKELIPLSARELSKGYYTSERTESMIKYIIGVDTQLIIDQTYYVAEADGQIVGCGGWSKRKTLYGGDQIKDIFVRSLFIRSGRARESDGGLFWHVKPRRAPKDLPEWIWVLRCRANRSMQPWVT